MSPRYEGLLDFGNSGAKQAQFGNDTEVKSLKRPKPTIRPTSGGS